MKTFEKSGPSHLKVVDWGNENHRRIIAASLVEGVYRQYRVRKNCGIVTKGFVSQWWEFFGFELVRAITDDKSRIFAAIYKFNLPPISCSSPEYVVAFRGTAGARDIIKDCKLVRNKFHTDVRCVIGEEEVDKLVRENQVSNIWIAGHSLGSSVGLQVGKAMAVKGIRLETFLFNPPFITFSLPVEWIPSKTIKGLIQVGRSLTNGVYAALLRSKSQREQTREQFLKAREWLPSLFVHGADVICSSYTDYFEARRLMKKFRLERVCFLATQHTRRCLSFHKAGPDIEPLHLIPSARLIINQTRLNFLKAHKLKQWWSSELPSNSEEYILEVPDDLSCKLR